MRLVPLDVEDVIVVNGDVVTDQPLAPLIRKKHEHDSIAAIYSDPIRQSVWRGAGF